MMAVLGCALFGACGGDDSAPATDAGPPDAPTGCPCFGLERCIEERCETAPTVNVTVLSDVDRLYACPYPMGGQAIGIQVKTDDCQLRALGEAGPESDSSYDFGEVTVEGLAGGAASVTPTDAPTGSCAQTVLSEAQPFSGGETVRFVSAGSPLVDSFDVELEAPPAVVGFAVPTRFVPGDDAIFFWSSRGSSRAFLILRSNDYEVLCRVDTDVGTITVPGELTGVFADGLTARLLLAATSTAEPPGSSVWVVTSLQSSGSGVAVQPEASARQPEASAR
jgi:hypothetical protein